MTVVSATQAFADAAAAMVQQQDVTGTLSRLLTDYTELTDAAAAGLLVKDERGELELLSASSHQATELELYQLQHDTGPCVDAATSESALAAYSDQDLTERWHQVGEAIIAAGYHAVVAVPMRWHGHVIGAMNAFYSAPDKLDHEARLLTQAFADVATVVIVQSTELSTDQLGERIGSALGGRTVVEQAKGVLAHSNNLDMAGAYDLLVQRATEDGATLTETAILVVEQAQRRA
jgi:transcriptional regulator with GAF, ATPase, and Fis domain